MMAPSRNSFSWTCARSNDGLLRRPSSGAGRQGRHPLGSSDYCIREELRSCRLGAYPTGICCGE